MFGYELAAVKDDKIPGGYRITTFRIDSMVTRIQEKLWEYSVPDDAQLAFAAYVADIHNSIDPRLRDYDNKIDLPDGLYRSLKPPSMFTAELKKYGLSLPGLASDRPPEPLTPFGAFRHKPSTNKNH